MSDPAVFAQLLGGVEVLACQHAAKGSPALIPDPREHGLALTPLYCHAPRPRRQPTRFVIVVHPDDLDRLPAILEETHKARSERQLGESTN